MRRIIDEKWDDEAPDPEQAPRTLGPFSPLRTTCGAGARAFPQDRERPRLHTGDCKAAVSGPERRAGLWGALRAHLHQEQLPPAPSVGAATTGHCPLSRCAWRVCVTSFSSLGPFQPPAPMSFSGPRTRESRGAGCSALSRAWISGSGWETREARSEGRLGLCRLSLPLSQSEPPSSLGSVPWDIHSQPERKPRPLPTPS